MNKEINSVLKLDRNKQYEYFVKKVVDFEEIWSLRDDEGWASLGDNENEFLPLWPKKEFADRCISEERASYYPEAIDLEEFIEDWIPGLIEDNVKITLMWNEGRGIEIPCESLKRDLEMEMKNY